MGTGSFFWGLKWPGREADHSPSPMDKNVWWYINTSQYVFMAWCLIKHRDNFTVHATKITPVCLYMYITNNFRNILPIFMKLGMKVMLLEGNPHSYFLMVCHGGHGNF
jgi:hypothetical protein